MSKTPQPPAGWSSIARRCAIVAGLVCGATILYVVDPAQARWLPKCPLYVLTGWYCPGCGSTRAAHALLHGEVSQALAKNALLVFAAPIALAVWAWNCRPGRAASGVWSTTLPAGWIWSGLVVVLAFAILRNIPAYPFDLLAPH